MRRTLNSIKQKQLVDDASHDEKTKAMTITNRKEPIDIPNFLSLDLSEAMFLREKIRVDKVTTERTIIANHII